VVALEDVSLTVQPGKVTGLIGPNGAGKTTLIDGVTGFARPAAGRVRLDGRDLLGLAPHRRAKAGLSRSFQSLELFEDLTVYENLLTASDPEGFAAYATELVWPRRSALPGEVVAAVRLFGLEPHLGEIVSSLPYGLRRLVAIARAVAPQPSVLMLDEPAAGLSESETADLAQLVRRLADEWGMAVLVIEHDIQFVMTTCDDIVVLDFGRAISSGSRDVVRNDPAVIAAYLGTAGAGQTVVDETQTQSTAEVTR
jgi:sulfate-transporting ATPase